MAASDTPEAVKVAESHQVQLLDESGNVLGTDANPLQLASTGSGNIGTPPNQPRPLQPLQIFDENHNVIGTVDNPLVVAGITGGSLIVSDGTTTVNPVSELYVTGGGTVTNLGSGVAGLFISGGGGGGITGTLTSGTIPVASGASSVADGSLTDDGAGNIVGAQNGVNIALRGVAGGGGIYGYPGNVNIVGGHQGSALYSYGGMVYISAYNTVAGNGGCIVAQAPRVQLKSNGTPYINVNDNNITADGGTNGIILNLQGSAAQSGALIVVSGFVKIQP
jgi:hypothetical protein